MSYKKELLETIDKQKEKISSYEKRLHDLIKAYKGLQKEKEALQNSLEALTNSNAEEDTNEELKGTNDEGKESVEPSEIGESDSESIVSSVENQELISLKRKVTALQASLKTLTAEHNKNESLMKEDRKKLLDEKKKIENDLSALQSSSSSSLKQMESRLEETRNKLAICQQEREKDSTNGMTMIREIESRLARERKEKEKLEASLHDMKERQRVTSSVPRTNEKDQKQITDLQNELQQVRNQLKSTVEQMKEPPLLKELQNQLQSMQLQYRQASIHEQNRAEAAEKALREASSAHEERVCSLENRLAELSLNAARYDRTKQNQLDTIQSLRDRIDEFSKISEAGTQDKTTSEPSIENDNKRSTSTILIQDFFNLWDKIISLKEPPGIPPSIESFLLECDAIHIHCKAEFEKFKQEKMMASRSQSNKDCSCDRSKQVEELKDRIRSLTSNLQLTQKAHSEQIATLTNEAATERQLHSSKIHQMEHEQKVAVAALEQQLSDHCQKSLETLQERDQEIHRLSLEMHKLKKDAQAQPRTVAAALLAQVENQNGPTEAPLLHHWEEMARKEIEVGELRRDKRQLERALRDIQSASIEKQEFLSNRIESLQYEVSRQKRNVSREGENLEYLKNVVLQFMTSSSVHSKQLMLNAISAVLKFTPQELESARNYMELWWWQGPPRKDRKGSIS